MTTAVAPTRSFWHCEPNYVVCPNGHVLRFHASKYAGDFSNLAGHAFLSCKACEPATYFLAHFVAEPHPIVMCYALSAESYKEWQSRKTPPTAELLYHLRDPMNRTCNPTWRVAG